jgi:hypothetical protein
MSRGPGKTQMLVLRALLLSALATGAVEAEDGTLWHGMSGITTDIRMMEPGLDRATIRRAVRALERAGYVDVKRGRVMVSAGTGQQIGHAQNLVRLNDRGHAYLQSRLR